MIKDEKPGTGFVIYFNGRRVVCFISKDEVNKYGQFDAFYYSIVQEQIDIRSWYIRGIQINI